MEGTRVTSCAVDMLGEGASARLCAWIVASGEIHTDDLRKHLKERLPVYMVPTVWEEVDHLPLTANGKIDRKALRSSSKRKAGRRQISGIEREVVSLLSNLLGEADVDPDLGFYSNGGHSLIAMRLVAMLNRKYGVNLTVGELLRLDTPAQIALRLDKDNDKQERQTVII